MAKLFFRRSGRSSIDVLMHLSLLAILIVLVAPAAKPHDAIAEATCPADLNGDQLVDVADLAALLAAWGPCAIDDDPPDDDDEFVLDETLRPYLIAVTPPAPPQDDAGVIEYTDITTWPRLQHVLTSARDDERLVIVDMGGRALEAGTLGRAAIKGDDLILRNFVCFGQIELNQDARRIVIENVRLVPGDGEDAIRTVARNGTRPMDVLLRDVIVEGDGASHALDCSRGIERLRAERLTATGVRYGAYFDGGSRDVELIQPVIGQIASEHGLRVQNTVRMNVLGGTIEAGPKTAITIRRGANRVAVLGVATNGSVSIGPDKREFDQPVNSKFITIAGCTIDTRHRADRPMVLWPPVIDSRIVANTFWNDADDPRGYLLIAPEQFGRTPQPVTVGGNIYNGLPMSGADGVDGPPELVLVD